MTKPFEITEIQPLEILSFPEFVYAYNIWREWDTPKFHLEMAKYLGDNIRYPYLILQGYRHSAKSHVAVGLYVCWRLYLDSSYTCIIASAISSLAKRNSYFIRETISTFPLLEHLRLPMNMKREGQWGTIEFTVNRSSPDLDPSVKVTSITSTFTGLHAHEIIADDVEVSDNIRSQENRDYLWDRVEEFMSVSDFHRFIGTPHTEDTVYKRLMNTTNKYKIKKFPFYKKDKIPQCEPKIKIHNQYHNEKWIEKKRAGMSDGRYRSQYLLIPEKSDELFFDINNIKIFESDIILQEGWDNLRGDVWDHYITLPINGKQVQKKLVDIIAYWDPATGMKNRSQSVLAIVALTENNYIVQFDAAVLPEVNPKKGIGFDIQCQAVLNLCQKYYIRNVTVEQNFQMLLANQLRKTAQTRHIRVGIDSHTRKGGKFGATNKFEFISQNLEPIINFVGNYFVHKTAWDNSPLRAQLSDYPHTRLLDALDATAGAISRFNMRGINFNKNNQYITNRPIRKTPSVTVVNKW